MIMSARTAGASCLPLVCIVEDDPDVSEAIALLLEVSGYHVRCWPDADTFLAEIEPGQAGCLLLDIRLPGRSGLDLLAALPGLGIHLPTIIVTGHADVAITVRAMKLGALDLLQKPIVGAVLLDRVRTALAFDTERRRQAARTQRLCERRAQLSLREREVFDLVLAGRLNKVIAAELGISVSTVEVHRRRVMEKLEVRNLARLVHLYAGLPP